MRLRLLRFRSLVALSVWMWMATAATAADASGVDPDDFRFSDTRALHHLCAADDNDPLFNEARQACFAFMYGVGLFYKEAVDAGRARKVVCPGGELTREAMREVFVGWAEANPERMGEGPIEGLFRAAKARWPCPETPPQ